MDEYYADEDIFFEDDEPLTPEEQASADRAYYQQQEQEAYAEFLMSPYSFDQELVGSPPALANQFTKTILFFPVLIINVGGRVYNLTMKKRKPPLNKVAQATRNAHSAELFRSLMLNKHLVITPATRKGSRQANIRKAINESMQPM